MENIIIEEYRKVAGFEHFTISNLGNIRNYNNNIVNPRLRGKGKYHSVNFFDKNQIMFWYFLQYLLKSK